MLTAGKLHLASSCNGVPKSHTSDYCVCVSINTTSQRVLPLPVMPSARHILNLSASQPGRLSTRFRTTRRASQELCAKECQAKLSSPFMPNSRLFDHWLVSATPPQRRHCVRLASQINKHYDQSAKRVNWRRLADRKGPAADISS